MCFYFCRLYFSIFKLRIIKKIYWLIYYFIFVRCSVWVGDRGVMFVEIIVSIVGVFILKNGGFVISVLNVIYRYLVIWYIVKYGVVDIDVVFVF